MVPSSRRLAAALVAMAALGCPNAFAADDGCKTMALGIMRCDTHSERTRADVMATLGEPMPPANPGCKTIANGIMRCAAHSQRTRDDVMAELRGPTPVPNPGCRTIASGIMRCDVPAGAAR
jgi:hypothetical protein